MDGPDLPARDLALLATADPEAFWSALHELRDAVAAAAHPDAALLALGAELHALAEALQLPTSSTSAGAAIVTASIYVWTR